MPDDAEMLQTFRRLYRENPEVIDAILEDPDAPLILPGRRGAYLSAVTNGDYPDITLTDEAKRWIGLNGRGL